MNRTDYHSLTNDATRPDDVLLRMDLTSTIAHLAPLLVKPMLNLLESLLEKKPDLSDRKQFENLQNQFLDNMESVISKTVYIGSNNPFYPGRSQIDINNNFNDYVISALLSTFKRFSLKKSLTDVKEI